MNYIKNKIPRHIFEYENEWTDDDKKQILSDLKRFDLKQVLDLYDKKYKKKDLSKVDIIDKFQGNIANFTTASNELKEKWLDAGLKAISSGKIACILMAGGQGTRLGYNKPKRLL